MAPLGWTVNLQLDGRDLPQVRALIDGLPGKVVIDHTGKFLEPVAPQHAAFRALQAVLDRPQRWVKLSAPYETSKSGPPGYEDVSLLARTLVGSHPDRCLWASNWPHPNRRSRPDDADMLALLYAWAPDAAVRRRILVDNAAAAFDFAGAVSAP
jgi:D-galactarolactone isomerase